MIAADGRMLACQMDGQVVAYDVQSGQAKVLADSYDGKRFNAPNDLVIDKQGGIYFTDPLFRRRSRCRRECKRSTTSPLRGRSNGSPNTSPPPMASVYRLTESGCT